MVGKKVNNQTSFEDKIINIKVKNKEQIISSFSYDENDKLNKDLSDFIVDKTKRIKLSQNVKLNFFTKEYISKDEIKMTIQNHFREEYVESKEDLKRSNIFVITMFLLGIITFAGIIALHNYEITNFYLEMILEIAAWVFIWEAVDTLFIGHPKIRRKCLLMQKIFFAEVEIITDNNLKINKEKTIFGYNERKK